MGPFPGGVERSEHHTAKAVVRPTRWERPEGRGRRAKYSRSRFVLTALAALSIYVAGTGWELFGALSVRSGLTTVICPELIVSRASVAAVKLQDPAEASLTICWRQFLRA